MVFLRIAEELSVGLNSPVGDTQFVLSPQIPDCVILLSEALFRASRPFFFHLQLSRGTTIAAEIGQAVVDLKLEVKLELVLTHYHCHGMGSNT